MHGFSITIASAKIMLSNWIFKNISRQLKNLLCKIISDFYEKLFQSINSILRCQFTFNWVTHRERIARHSIRATAHRGMIYDCALCILPADSSAWIEALVTNAGFV